MQWSSLQKSMSKFMPKKFYEFEPKLLFSFSAFGFIGSLIFYWFAQSDQFRDEIAKPVITSLYHRYQWRWLRKEHALEVIFIDF